MAASKAGFMKDAFILFAITLVSGICLGFVYEITKGPIEQATIAANNATYQAVLPAASQFDAVEGSEEQAAVLNASGELSQYGNVGVESVLEGTDASGNPVGYVLNTYSNDSYGGLVSLSVGVDMEGTIVGVGIREISDTPGLGLKAQDAEYTDQFVGKERGCSDRDQVRFRRGDGDQRHQRRDRYVGSDDKRSERGFVLPA